MENITFKCRSCHTTYCVKPTLAGRTAECTKCGQRMQVPYRSPVVKLNDEMIDEGAEEQPHRHAMKPVAAVGAATDDDAPIPVSSGRTFDEYDHLRKPGKAKAPKDPDEPFVPLPDILNDIWIPLGIALVFYGLSAYLVFNYISNSYGPRSGWVIVAMSALGIYAGVLPLTVRVIEAGADSFDFKPTNALWLQVASAMSLPLFGILFGMLSAGSTAAAVAFGLIGACFALVALAIFFQTSPAKGFQTATMATMGFGVATTLTFLIVWGLSVWFIPRWGMNLPWVKPLTPEEVAAQSPRPVKVAGGGTADNPAAAPAPTAPAATGIAKGGAGATASAGSPGAPDKSKSALFDMTDADGLGGAAPTTAPAGSAVAGINGSTPSPAAPAASTAGSALPPKPAIAGATDSTGAGASFDTPRPADTPSKPLTDVARQREWTVTVVSIGLPQVDPEALKTAELEAREAQVTAERARAQLRRLETDTVTTYSTDVFGRRRSKQQPRASAQVIGEARTESRRADRAAGEKQGTFKRLQKDLEKSTNQRLVQAVCDESGAALEILALAPAVVKTVDGIQSGTHWTVKGTGKLEGNKVSVTATAVEAPSPGGATPAAPVPASGVADAVQSRSVPAVKPAPAAAGSLVTPKVAPTPAVPVRD
jgi:hypothetical protein